MVNTYEQSQHVEVADLHKDYFTAEEVSKFEGVKKEAILKRCRSGKYPGAFKTQPTPENPQGLWLIPKNLFGATATQDIVVLPKQMAPGELSRYIAEGVRATIKEELAPFKDEIASLRAELEAHNRQVDERLRSAVNKSTEKKSFIKRLFNW